ncbi:hypothetical protein J4218_04285 [Candidatus Pacearchaeota archaeon]|nr:hypothetical protein [Candidatus Pacearchaeota archaeon]
MVIERRLFLAGGLGGLAKLVFGNVSEASPSNEFTNIAVFARREYDEYLKRVETRRQLTEKLRFSYEEFKFAIENPNSKQAALLKYKASLYKQYPEIALSTLSSEEREEFDDFWKTFNLDVGKLKFDDKNQQYRELLFNYVMPTLVEMQVDIDRTYAPLVVKGEFQDSKGFFDYANPNDGEKVIMFLHFRKYLLRYYAEGGKRKGILDK